MLFAYSRDNAMPHFNLLEMFTLENIYKFRVALFTLKITNNATSVPPIFSGTLTLASEVQSYNTRFVSNLNFHRPRITQNCLKIVSNFTRLTAREITFNNLEISLVVFMPNITTNHTITYTNNTLKHL